MLLFTVITIVSHKSTCVYNQKLFRGCFYPIPAVPFVSSLSLLCPPPRSDPSNPAKGFGERCSLPQCGENNICSHQTRSLGYEYATDTFAAEPRRERHFLVCLESRNVSRGCNINVVLFLLKRI